MNNITRGGHELGWSDRAVRWLDGFVGLVKLTGQ